MRECREGEGGCAGSVCGEGVRVCREGEGGRMCRECVWGGSEGVFGGAFVEEGKMCVCVILDSIDNYN